MRYDLALWDNDKNLLLLKLTPADVEVHQEERNGVGIVLGGRGQDSHPGNNLVSSFHRALRRSLWGREDIEFITISGGLKIYKIVISLTFNHHLF